MPPRSVRLPYESLDIAYDLHNARPQSRGQRAAARRRRSAQMRQRDVKIESLFLHFGLCNAFVRFRNRTAVGGRLKVLFALGLARQLDGLYNFAVHHMPGSL